MGKSAAPTRKRTATLAWQNAKDLNSPMALAKQTTRARSVTENMNQFAPQSTRKQRSATLALLNAKKLNTRRANAVPPLTEACAQKSRHPCAARTARPTATCAKQKKPEFVRQKENAKQRLASARKSSNQCAARTARPTATNAKRLALASGP